MSVFKVVHMSDSHFGLTTYGTDNSLGINSRAEDGLQAFDQVINYAIKHNVKLILHSGDFFNSKSTSQIIINEIYKRIKRISDNGIDFFLLYGNHDLSRLGAQRHPLDITQILSLPHIYITKGHEDEILDLGYIQIFAPNYWNDVDTLATKINNAFVKIDKKRPSILTVHAQVEFADFPGSFKEDLHFTPLSVLTSHKVSYCALGHIHAEQKLNNNPPTYYAGSLVRTDFNCENYKPGFNVIEIDGIKPVKVTRQTVDCLKMLTLRGTMTEIKKSIKNVDTESFKDCIVRCIVDETNETTDDKYLRDKFIHAFKCIITKEKQKVKIIKSTHTNLMNMPDAINTYFEQDKDRKALLELALELQNIVDIK